VRDGACKILAEVEFTPGTQGVIVAQGARFGGHALFVEDGNLYCVFNPLGIPPEQKLVGPAPTSGQQIVGVDFTKDRIGEHGEAHGTCTLFVDDNVIAEQEIRTIAAFYALCGEGLCVGYDRGDAVSSEYRPKFEVTDGTITKVVFDVADDAYVDVERERHLAAALARD
jgi:arylsulfatase